MTEAEDEYYVAELVSDYQEEHDVELSEQEREDVAELQSIYREFDLEDIVANEEQLEQLSDDEQRTVELIYSEFIRRGRNQSPEQREQLFDYFGIDEERVAELSEEVYDV